MQSQSSSDYFTCRVNGESTASNLPPSQMLPNNDLAAKTKLHDLREIYSNGNDAPPWACKLISDVKAIKNSVQKLQRTVNCSKKNAGRIVSEKVKCPSYNLDTPHSKMRAVYYLSANHGYIRVGNTRVEMEQKAYMSIVEHSSNVRDLVAGLMSALYKENEMSTSNITGISKSGKQLHRLDRERLIAIYRQIDLQYPKQRNTLNGRSQIYEAINKKCKQIRFRTS